MADKSLNKTELVAAVAADSGRPTEGENLAGLVQRVEAAAGDNPRRLGHTIELADLIDELRGDGDGHAPARAFQGAIAGGHVDVGDPRLED